MLGREKKKRIASATSKKAVSESVSSFNLFHDASSFTLHDIGEVLESSDNGSGEETVTIIPSCSNNSLLAKLPTTGIQGLS